MTPIVIPSTPTGMDQYTVTAAYGGITTVIAFVGNVAGWGFNGYTTDLVKGFIEEGERISHLDFSVHGTYTAADEDILDKSIPELMKLGVISFKMFLAYKRRGMAITEDGLLKTMDLAASEGGPAHGPLRERLLHRLSGG